MGEKYEKDGNLYEREIFGEDRKIGSLEKSVFGEYVKTNDIFEGNYDVERNNSTGELEVTTREDYLSNEREGFTIERNPLNLFESQKSHDWKEKIYEDNSNDDSDDNSDDEDNSNNSYDSNYSNSYDIQEENEPEESSILGTIITGAIAYVAISLISDLINPKK